MGATLTEMASASFHIDAGQSKSVPFSVTMPTTPGTYPVYLKVTSGGVLIGTFVATEDVVIAQPKVNLQALAPGGGWYVFVLDTGLQTWIPSSPSLRAQDPVATPTLSYVISSKKFLIVLLSDGWPIVTEYYYGPFGVIVSDWGNYIFDANTLKLNGVALTDISAIPNKSKITGVTNGAGYWAGGGVSFPRVWAVGFNITSSQPYSGYADIGSYLVGTTLMAFCNAGEGGLYPFPTGYPAGIKFQADLSVSYWYPAQGLRQIVYTIDNQVQIA
jgi:hypothetical protein